MLVVALVGPPAGRADEVVIVTTVDDGLTLVAADGRRLRLAGLLSIDPAHWPPAERFISEMISGRQIDWQPLDLPADRYGRFLGNAYLVDGEWLNEVVIGAGHAVVDPQTMPNVDRVRLLRAERSARSAGRGNWRRGGGFRLTEAESYNGPVHGFAIVEGRVLTVTEQRRFIYLNFADNWRRDFTIGIDLASLDALAETGLNPRTLAGKKVRIRGWVGWYYGPFIKLDRSGQLEMVEEDGPTLGLLNPPR